LQRKVAEVEELQAALEAARSEGQRVQGALLECQDMLADMQAWGEMQQAQAQQAAADAQARAPRHPHSLGPLFVSMCMRCSRAHMKHAGSVSYGSCSLVAAEVCLGGMCCLSAASHAWVRWAM
jgi:hypothetical protein